MSCCVKEVTPRSYQLFNGAAWWQRYHASHCPEGPGSEVFTVLLWHRDRVQGAPQWAQEIPFDNSIMGALSACWQRLLASKHMCKRAVPLAAAQLASCPQHPAVLGRPSPAPGRDVKTITGTVCGQPVRVATTHLESHLDGDSKGEFRRARKEQCQQAAALLTPPCFESAGPQDVLLAGDMVS